MTVLPSATPPAKSLTDLDHRIEAAVGYNIDHLWKHHDRGLLDEPLSRLAEAHRGLSDAERGVTFHRVLLHRLASGEIPMDQRLITRIERVVGQLKATTETRDARQAQAVAALEPVEAAAPAPTALEGPELTAPEFAALLAISQGANLHQHLQTGRLSVITASTTRLPHTVFQRLEAAGLVTRDTSRPIHAGQPISLSEEGRTTVTGGARRDPVPTAVAAPSVGSWPTPARSHR
ncbi:hypothetical protein [Streptomyces sp. NPDC093225]|uniref:hypothetical protein n=1 Tax=Streptomyces sp. NPDC093225 TaxID=3366034 RepID=UPI0037FC6BA7